MAEGTSSLDAKRALRIELRAWRRGLTDQVERSALVRQILGDLELLRAMSRVLVFSSISGEPQMDGVIHDLRQRGTEVRVPEDDPPPSWPDAVIVPGIAFTSSGDRLGQGGGWYDRFLSEVRTDCVTVGVCFFEQVVDDLPIEPHDVRVDVVVTERGVVQPPG
ncbi:MAG: 5-formyltetrahydrofolate cyclo-ligase [Actinomycetota bacterium]